MRGTLRLLTALALLGPGAAYPDAAQVWPSEVVRLEDGRLEYRYDLRPFKRGTAALDLGPEVDDDALDAFLRALPDRTQVVVDPGQAPLELHAQGELKQTALAPSFAKVAPAGAQGWLPSADLLLWRHKVAEEGALAGLLQGAQQGGAGLPQDRRTFVGRVLARAVQRAGAKGGVSGEGAARLAARLGAALDATSDPSPRPHRAVAAAREKAEAEALDLGRFTPRFPPEAWRAWRPSLEHLVAWDRALQLPFENSRQGAAAALTFLAILEQDPQLQDAYQAHLRFSRGFFGLPEEDALIAYREALDEGGAQAALDDMSAFLARLPRAVAEKEHAPGLFPAPQSPISRFLRLLQGPERLQAIDELTVAVQEGLVDLPAGEAPPWAAAQGSWYRAMLQPEVEARLLTTADYRRRLGASFRALLGAPEESSFAPPEPEQEPAEAPDGGLRLRLMVPPHLELEPSPAAYEEVANSWRRLGAALQAHGRAGALRGVSQGGAARALPLLQEARQMQSLFHGLALASKVALGEPPPLSDADRAALTQARRFLAKWREDPDLRQDPRYLFPLGEAQEADTYRHSGVLGVGERTLEVRYHSPPKVELRAKDPGLFVTDAQAVGRYRLPVLATGTVVVPRVQPLPAAELRAVCDAARTQSAIESALPPAMVRTLRRVEADAR